MPVKKIELLTVKKVQKLLRRGEAGRHFDGHGLYLVVENKKNANWARRYELHKKAHQIGLGSAFAFTLAEARERNRKISQQLADNIDPLALKRQQRADQAASVATTKTFKECAEAYIAAHQAEWRSAKHGHQWTRTLEQYVYPRLGHLDVRAIARPHVLDVLEQHTKEERGHPAGKFWDVRTVTANRTRNRIELVLNLAKARGYRDGDNPARWEDLMHILAAPSKTARPVHHEAVPYAELPMFMSELRKREGTGAKALQFLVLTATRTSDVLGAIWDEIDLAKKEWTIPAERIKGKGTREHKVPLSPAAIELLKSLPTEAGNPFVFLGPRGQALSHVAMRQVMKRLRRTETPHGMRSSFSDWAHEQTAHSNHTIELSLAHTIGNAAEKAYRRGDMLMKRRKLMEQWARYCGSGAPARKASKGNVVAIGSVR
jgi:integrase